MKTDLLPAGWFSVSLRLTLLPLSGLSLLICACSPGPWGYFSEAAVPVPPNYSRTACWAALPFTVDNADRTPAGLTDAQKDAQVDVFFLHPTTFVDHVDHDSDWNGPVYDEALNRKTDESAIRYQASIFNGVGRVFAPRYRQAHLSAYFTHRYELSARQAFDLAYSDVRAAFEYYLKTYNKGRPIIIAGHSQGTTHAKRLLRDFFDGTPLQRQLVGAYLAGMPVEEDYFQFIKACGGPEETGCFCTWRSWRKGTTPKGFKRGNNVAVTNPLLWTTSDVYAGRSSNKGAVLSNFDKIIPGAADAQVHDGLLWVNRPRFPGSFLLYFQKNYHIGDFNLFYVNVRENARLRAEAFLKSAH